MNARKVVVCDHKSGVEASVVDMTPWSFDCFLRGSLTLRLNRAASLAAFASCTRAVPTVVVGAHSVSYPVGHEDERYIKELLFLRYRWHRRLAHFA